ncbi:MAG: succinate dehydrogenase cytochrome b subunit [Akkermansiaceae bacterium]|nr:succinate dehydrogenase cytochrome b subunit [Verrucomicrobiales bacterium]
MKVITNIFGSSLGKKYIMALTGLMMVLFVVGHLVGNLQIFLGPEAINRYGHFLQNLGEGLWVIRLSLLATIGLHIWAAIKLSAENKAARPIGYGEYKPVGSSYASRTMLMSGLIIFVFIIFHLLHYTVRVKAINFTGHDFHDPAFAEHIKGTVDLERHNVYKMMIVGFSNVWVSAFYALGVGLLCLHLSHGISAMFQSLGWKNKVYGPCLDRGARVMAVLIFLGYISIPAAILLGLVKEATK